jgi:polar amino acid transport system permease protein
VDVGERERAGDPPRLTPSLPELAEPASTRTRRDRYERRQRTRSIAAATTSTVVVVGLLVWLIPKTSGWEDVQQSFFNPDVFADVFPELLGPFWYDVQIFLWCAPCIVVVALLIAMARNIRAPALYPIKLFAILYTDVVRGVPVLLWILLLGFGVPGILQTREWYGEFIIWGSVALIVSYSAYVAEVFRSGIEGVHESQRAAARSLGLTAGQTMRSVVLPQAVRRVVPPLMNDFVSLQKDVALIGVLGPVEVLRRAQIEVARTFNFTPYVAAALLFLCVSIPLTRLTDHLLQRERSVMSATAVR